MGGLGGAEFPQELAGTASHRDLRIEDRGGQGMEDTLYSEATEGIGNAEADIVVLVPEGADEGGHRPGILGPSQTFRGPTAHMVVLVAKGFEEDVHGLLGRDLAQTIDRTAPHRPIAFAVGHGQEIDDLGPERRQQSFPLPIGERGGADRFLQGIEPVEEVFDPQ